MSPPEISCCSCLLGYESEKAGMAYMTFEKKNQTNLVFDTLEIIMKLFNLKNSCNLYPDIDVQTQLRHPHKSFKEVPVYERLCFFQGQMYFIIVTV